MRMECTVNRASAALIGLLCVARTPPHKFNFLLPHDVSIAQTVMARLMPLSIDSADVYS